MDDAVRAAERAFQASGSLEDGVRWLAERVRAGTITAERIALASQLGHAAAEAWCVNTGRPPPRPLNDDLWVWAVRAHELAPEAGMRIAAAAVLSLADRLAPKDAQLARTTCEAIVAWSAGAPAPPAAHVEVMEQARTKASSPPEHVQGRSAEARAARAAALTRALLLEAAARLAQVPRLGDPVERLHAAGTVCVKVAQASSAALDGNDDFSRYRGTWGTKAKGELAAKAREPWLLAVLRDAVMPWALREPDAPPSPLFPAADATPAEASETMTTKATRTKATKATRTKATRTKATRTKATRTKTTKTKATRTKATRTKA